MDFDLDPSRVACVSWKGRQVLSMDSVWYGNICYQIWLGAKSCSLQWNGRQVLNILKMFNLETCVIKSECKFPSLRKSVWEKARYGWKKYLT